MSSRAKRGICFFANHQKKRIARANRSRGRTLLEFFRNHLGRDIQNLEKFGLWNLSESANFFVGRGFSRDMKSAKSDRP